MKIYNKERWNSLSELKNAIVKGKKEKVTYFDGSVLVTNKYTYTLEFNELTRTANV